MTIGWDMGFIFGSTLLNRLGGGPNAAAYNKNGEKNPPCWEP